MDLRPTKKIAIGFLTGVVGLAVGQIVASAITALLHYGDRENYDASFYLDKNASEIIAEAEKNKVTKNEHSVLYKENLRGIVTSASFVGATLLTNYLADKYDLNESEKTAIQTSADQVFRHGTLTLLLLADYSVRAKAGTTDNALEGTIEELSSTSESGTESNDPTLTVREVRPTEPIGVTKRETAAKSSGSASPTEGLRHRTPPPTPKQG